MLNVVIFLPLLTAAAVLVLPTHRAATIRATALCGAVVTLALTLVLWAGHAPHGPTLQWRTVAAWIPGLDARYDVAVDGLSLPLMVLTALLLTAVMISVLPHRDRAKAHAVLFLIMATGLLGLFAAQDLLLFYFFFEIALVPMYFIIGVWGHQHRRYAALKFFLYTRAGSLAMLLAFLGLYLSATPHTFSLPALVAAHPLSGGGSVAGLVFFGMLLGFGVKIPTVPVHNWLPDAHVEAPTEGSVMLAGLQLKMGGYGLLRILLPTLPATARHYGWVLVALGLVSLIYGALAALGQRDFKRLVAYTSINHMGFVTLAAGIWALSSDPSVRALAVTGADYQMVSHGLLTGAMFFLAGMLQDQAGTRELARLGGLMRSMPRYSFILGLVAFGSLGLPGFSGFVAELQVIAATVSRSGWAAAITVCAVLLTTGLYLRLLMQLVMAPAPCDAPTLRDPTARQLGVVAGLTAVSLLLGIVPSILVSTLRGTAFPLPWTP